MNTVSWWTDYDPMCIERKGCNRINISKVIIDAFNDNLKLYL